MKSIAPKTFLISRRFSRSIGATAQAMRRCLTLALAAASVTAGAQYSISWFKVAGGGSTSTNGPFFLSGTVGQSDAGGPMTGGPYSLAGGYWVLPVAVPTPTSGAPVLHIVPAGPGEAMLSWTPAAPGWLLQEAPQPTGTWTNSPSGAANPVTVPATLPFKFYRLFKSP